MVKKTLNLGSADFLNRVKHYNKNISKTLSARRATKWYVEFDKKILYKYFYMSTDNNLLVENTI